MIRQSKPKKKRGLSIVDSLGEVLKEIYGHLYTEEEEAFLRLINRYASKLDKKYFERAEALKPEAKRRAQEIFKKIIYGRNPFLELARDESWSARIHL